MRQSLIEKQSDKSENRTPERSVSNESCLSVTVTAAVRKSSGRFSDRKTIDECADPKHGGRRVAATEDLKCSAAICGAFCGADCISSVRFLRRLSCFAAGRFHSRLYCGSGDFHTCVLRADVLAGSDCVQRKRKAEITRGSLRSRAG